MKNKNDISQIYNADIGSLMRDEFGKIKFDYIEKYIRQVVCDKNNGDISDKLHKLDELRVFLLPDSSEYFEYHESEEYKNEVDFKNTARKIYDNLKKELYDEFKIFLAGKEIEQGKLNELLLDRAKNGDIEISNLLIENGANPLIKDKDDKTAIEYMQKDDSNYSTIKKIYYSSLGLIPLEVLASIVLLSISLISTYSPILNIANDFVIALFVGGSLIGSCSCIHSLSSIFGVFNRVSDLYDESKVIKIAKEKFAAGEDVNINRSDLLSFNSLPYTTREEIKKAGNAILLNT
jgi:hypothetical protein